MGAGTAGGRRDGAAPIGPGAAPGVTVRKTGRIVAVAPLTSAFEVGDDSCDCVATLRLREGVTMRA